MKKFPKPWYRPSRGVWYVTLDGKQINLGPDEAEAFEQYKQLLAQPQKRAVPSDSLAGIIDAFLEWVQRHRAPDTYEWYRYRLQRFIHRYPDMVAGDLRPYHVETWADDYCTCVTSHRNYLRSVKRCMKWAKKQGYIDRNPVEDMEVPAAEAKEVYVSPEEFDRLLGYVRDRSFADLMETTYDCGCRPQELLPVVAANVDLANQRWVFRQSESKGKRLTRVIYLPDTAMAITQRLLLARPEGPLFRNVNGRAWTTDAVNCGFERLQLRIGTEEMRKRGEVIPDQRIDRLIPELSPTRIRKGRRVAKTKSELRCEAKRKLTNKRATELAPKCSLYALRHSWATNALKRGIDPLTVAILMGHQDPSMLAKVYQHLSLSPVHLLDQAKRAAGKCA